MTLSRSIALALVVLVAGCCLAVADSDVVVLTDANFDDLTKATKADGPNALVEFYAPWCGHCKNLAPTYEKVATALKGEVLVGKVDATVHKASAKRFGVRGYPTVVLVSGGKKYEFKGARTEEALSEFAKSGHENGEGTAISAAEAPEPVVDASNSDVVVLTDANFDKLTQKDGPAVLVKFYAPWCGHCKNLAPTYEKVATALKGEVIVGKVDATVHKTTAERFSVRGYPTVALVKGGQQYKFEGARTLDALSEFAKGGYKESEAQEIPSAASTKEEMPEGPSQVIDLDDSNFEEETQASTGSTTGDWLVEFYAPWCGHCKKLAPTYELVARALKGKVNVARVDATKNPGLARRFGVKGYPTVKMVSDGHEYTYSGVRSKSDLVEFATGAFAEVESKEIPAPPDFWQGIVLQVESEFKTLVADMKTLFRFKKNALIVTFSLGAVVGVIIAFGMFACMGGLNPPEEVVYQQAPAQAGASAAAAAAPAAAPAGKKGKKGKKKGDSKKDQ